MRNRRTAVGYGPGGTRRIWNVDGGLLWFLDRARQTDPHYVVSLVADRTTRTAWHLSWLRLQLGRRFRSAGVRGVRGVGLLPGCPPRDSSVTVTSLGTPLPCRIGGHFGQRATFSGGVILGSPGGGLQDRCRAPQAPNQAIHRELAGPGTREGPVPGSG